VLLCSFRRWLQSALAFTRSSAHFFSVPLFLHDSHLARDIREKCEDLVVVLLLPAFFAFTGMRTQVGLLKEPADWLVCVVIILIASVGKFGGSFFAAHITGSDNEKLPRRHSHEHSRPDGARVLNVGSTSVLSRRHFLQCSCSWP